MAPLPPFLQAFARVAVVAAPIVGRAFVDAYKQAMINARAAGAQNMMRNNKMSKDEATKILAVELGEDAEKIIERYQTLYNANDPEKGGSKFLREKIEIAKKILIDDPLSAAKEAEAAKQEAAKEGAKEGGEKK